MLWQEETRSNIRAFGNDFDISVVRTEKGKLNISITPKDGKTKVYKIKEGDSLKVNL